MIMRHELSDRIPQPFLTKEDHLLRATLFDRADEPFRICIQIRRPRWQFHGFDADRTKCGQKFPRVQRISIVDQISFSNEETIHGIR